MSVRIYDSAVAGMGAHNPESENKLGKDNGCDSKLAYDSGALFQCKQEVDGVDGVVVLRYSEQKRGSVFHSGVHWDGSHPEQHPSLPRRTGYLPS